jgi:hypothetical protein
MPNWFLGLACLNLACVAQADEKAATLPPLNEKVVEFARSNLGKPVGDGVCITLAVEALREAGARRVSFRDPSGDYVWGELVADFKDVQPGDILQFRDAVFKGQRPIGGGRILRWRQEYPHHTAIVARVERGGKTLAIYHQNVAVQGRPESEKGNVSEGELRMDSLQKGGWVRAYRPVARQAEPARKPFADEPEEP